MPITPTQAVSTLVPNLQSSSMLGVGVPKLSRAIGVGLASWTPTIVITTTDQGTVGAGVGVPIPITIAQALLYGNLLTGMHAEKLVGSMHQPFVSGLSRGLLLLYAQCVTSTAHVGVGVGSGVASFKAPPAFASIQGGFASEGMTGEGCIKFARALSRALERTFQSLILIQPIVGATAPSGSSGRGVGSIR